MVHRYALYLAPAADSPLHTFASGWLGRDAVTGESLPQPEVAHVAPDRFREITASPRRYGFHATLKAPFRLARGRTATELHERVGAFAKTIAPFEIQLEVKSLRGFLAFMLARPSPQLAALQEACVRDFEPFRAPLSDVELEKRMRSPLTPRQLEHLERWGYPYVMEDFVFHMTLTDKLHDNLHDRVLTDLCARTFDLTRTTFPVDAVCVFEEAAPHGTFQLAARYALGA